MIKTYYMLTKPGIIAGNLLTTLGGFALASRGHWNIALLVFTVLGLGMIIASACVCNNAIDRKADAQMSRTKNRALVKGTVSVQAALFYALLLLAGGMVILYGKTNVYALGLALLGFFFYVALYSYSKYRSTSGTLIGSIAGAIPPVVGYCAAAPSLNMGALLLFSLLFFWQMPHFYAIAIYRCKEYAAAGIPVLPVVKGNERTKGWMITYIALFLSVVVLLFQSRYISLFYFLSTVSLGLVWLALGLRGITVKNDVKWARGMFVFSLVVILVSSLLLCLPISSI